MEYNVEYFIAKFEAIPENKWCVGALQDHDRCCAQGHCGVTRENHLVRYNRASESYALIHIMGGFVYDGTINAALINNGCAPKYQQETPKQRILAALYDIRDKELSEANLKEASKIVSEELVSV